MLDKKKYGFWGLIVAGVAAIVILAIIFWPNATGNSTDSETASSTIEILEFDLANLEIENENLLNSVAALQSRNISVSSERNTLKIERDALKIERDALKKSDEEKQTIIDGLKVQNSQILGIVGSLQNDLASLQTLYNQVKVLWEGTNEYRLQERQQVLQANRNNKIIEIRTRTIDRLRDLSRLRTSRADTL